METGTYISGLGHFAVIGWAILGGMMPSTNATPEFQVTDVSVMSEAAFAAMVSDAPLTASDIQQPNTPDSSDLSPDTPNADKLPRLVPIRQPDAPADAGDSPDLSAVIEAPQTDAQTEAPEFGSQPTTQEQGASLIVPTAPLADQDRNGLRQPDQLAMVAPEAPAPRVDVTPALAPPTDAEKAREAEKATTPDVDATTPAKESTEKAPDQAATEIITEAKQQDSISAPVRSSRPKGRPAKLAQKNTGPSAIELALAQAQAEAAAKPTPKPAAIRAPSGPPLTSGEREGLRLAVRECWSVNPSSEAARITVTVGVALDRKGKPVGAVQYLNASDGSAKAQKSAYEAARRAVLRCGGKGFDLPTEKYEQWRDIEITFNPEKMRRK